MLFRFPNIKFHFNKDNEKLEITDDDMSKPVDENDLILITLNLGISTQPASRNFRF